MRFTRYFDKTAGKSRGLFQTEAEGPSYHIEDVLGPHCHFLFNYADNVNQLRSCDLTSLNPVEIDHNTLLPPFTPSSFRDFYAFEQHVKTCRAKRGLEMNPDWYEVPVFYFSNPFSMVGHGQQVHAPKNCDELDFELELGIVISKGGRNITAADAWKHVAGFTIITGISARDLQRKEMGVGLGPAKGKDFATGLGPCLITFDEFTDNINGEEITLEMTARLNGKEISRGNSSTLYHSFPKLIEQSSLDTDLKPGDLIGSGTVGTGCILELGAENTGGYLKPGDLIELNIEKLGTLSHHISERK